MVLRKSEIQSISCRVTILEISRTITCNAPMAAGNAGEAPAGLGPLLAQHDRLISQPVLSIPNTI